MSKVQMSEIIDVIPVAKLKNDPRNARTHSHEQVQQIADSIKQFGFRRPIEVDEDNVILSGHGRLAACHLLGLKAVPCVRVTGLSEAQRRAYALADNKIALNAGWNVDLLTKELDSLKLELPDLTVTGFSDFELQDLMKGLNADLDSQATQTVTFDAKKKSDPAPDETIVKPGEVWLLGPHRLMVGQEDLAFADHAIAAWQKKTKKPAVCNSTGRAFGDS